MLQIVWKFARQLFNVPFPALHREQRSRNRPDHRGLHPRFEQLEQRRLLAIDPIGFESSTSTIVIQGTPHNDTATVEVSTNGAILVRVQNSDGNFQTVFPSSTPKAVKFPGGGGDDTFQNFSHLPSEANGDAGKDTFVGGSNRDVLLGGAGDDSLFGGAGDDHLNGEDGDDHLSGDDGNDWLSGWTGNDSLQGGRGKDYIAGSIGDDVLDGGDDIDELYGQEGNDQLSGGAGNDVLGGSVGNDKLHGGTGDDHLSGEEGDDELYGNDGNDWLSGWVGNDVLYGGAGNDELTGSDGFDSLYGDDGNDLLYGNAHNDGLWGGAGNDSLYGEGGNNSLIGGPGDDTLVGSVGNDLLDGGAGADSLLGSEGDDVLIGGLGVDDLRGENGVDLMLGGTTVHENDWASYMELFGAWTAPVPYSTRVENITSDLFAARLESEETVFDDGVLDALYGGGGQDWFFVTGAMPFYRPAFVEPLVPDAHAHHHHHPPQTAPRGDYNNNGKVDDADYLVWRANSGKSVTPGTLGDGTMDGLVDAADYAVWRKNLGASVGGGDQPLIIDHLPALEGFDLIDSLDKLSDRQTNEAIHSALAHVENLVLQREHLSLFELVRYDQVTHIAVRSGAWSESSTWADGTIPTSGSRILIPYGVKVQVNQVVSASIATIRVDGTLSFDPSRNTELRVDTVVVSSQGTFQMGTAAAPIAPGVQARLLITGASAINRQLDPFGISRGLVSHGKVSIHGAETSSIAALAAPVNAGVAALQLKSVPVGWRVGDSIAIAGTVTGTAQNEVRRILSIQGNTVQLDQPLSFTHAAPTANLDVHVANLTRNAVIESENALTARRGHVMFMHSRDVDIAYAGFYKLGRSDKLQVVDDAAVGADWKLQPGTGNNPRGRYAVHFHRNGLANDGHPAVVKGSAVVDSPGWGFVNHSSYVDMSQNVAYNVRGAAFATEVGDEIGGFYGNMAIGSSGTGQEPNAREHLNDFGHQGDGFWFQGAGVSVVGNISAGNQGNAFAYYTRGLYENGVQARFLSANLTNPAIANGEPTIDIGLVPVTNFSGNAGYASAVGLLVRYHLQGATHGQPSLFRDSQFWNNPLGVGLHYAQNSVLRNLTITRIPDGTHSYGVDADIIESNIVYDNLTVIGYHTGIEMPRWGNNVVSGGTFNNTDHDILIPTAALHDRTVLITGLIGTPRVTLLDDVRPIPNNNAFLFFVNDRVVLNFGPLQSKRVYYWRQQADVVPFPEARADVPAAYVGLTNRQLWESFGKALSGEVAPAAVYTLPYISGGLIAL